MHRRGPASFHDVDGIGFQNLHGAQHSLLWRRRLCTALRIAVACTVVARLSVSAPAGVVAPVITAALRSRPFRPVQDLQRRTLAAIHAAPGCHGFDGFDGSGAGGSFGGDECQHAQGAQAATCSRTNGTSAKRPRSAQLGPSFAPPDMYEVGIGRAL